MTAEELLPWLVVGALAIGIATALAVLVCFALKDIRDYWKDR